MATNLEKFNKIAPEVPLSRPGTANHIHNLDDGFDIPKRPETAKLGARTMTADSNFLSQLKTLAATSNRVTPLLEEPGRGVDNEAFAGEFERAGKQKEEEEGVRR